MTLVIGWHRGSSVLLAADTVLSTRAPIVRPNTATTFGDAVPDRGQWSILDAGFKLRNYGCFTIGFSADDTRDAESFIEAVHECTRCGDSMPEAINRAVASISGGSRDLSFDVLIAWADTVAHLAMASARGRRVDLAVLPPGAVVPIGTGAQLVQPLLSSLVNPRAGPPPDDDDAMVSLLVLLQLTVATDPAYLSHGAGGTFFGRIISTTGSEWAPRITYLIEPTRTQGNRMLVVGVAEERLVTLNYTDKDATTAGIDWNNDPFRLPIVIDVVLRRMWDEVMDARRIAWLSPDTLRGIVYHRFHDGTHPTLRSYK